MNSKRGKEESFKDYKSRQKRERIILKVCIRGRLIWNSVKGQYYRKKHGPIGNVNHES